MIDFHNHILPNMDDGSKSLEMSLSMLRSAAEQGITDIVNTVHFQHPKVDGKDISFEACQPVLNALQAESDKAGFGIKLHLGAEVFYLPNLLDITDNPLVTFGGGKYMLIEFLTHHIPSTQRQVLFDLKMKGITPIIAHPERYRPVQEDMELVRRWIRSGCLIQVDAGSLTGALGKSAQHTATEIVKLDLCQVLGSDAHDDHHRNFVISDALQICEKLIGNRAQTLVESNPLKVLNGEPIVIDLDEDSRPKEKFYMKWIRKSRKK
ncbi:MAG: phosphotransferase [Candidatus Marinimicrobia bacterium]|nr:phosphotransferase [Candidatus Neomarinimicrobiota bacterium]